MTNLGFLTRPGLETPLRQLLCRELDQVFHSQFMSRHIPSIVIWSLGSNT